MRNNDDGRTRRRCHLLIPPPFYSPDPTRSFPPLTTIHLHSPAVATLLQVGKARQSREIKKTRTLIGKGEKPSSTQETFFIRSLLPTDSISFRRRPSFILSPPPSPLLPLGREGGRGEGEANKTLPKAKEDGMEGMEMERRLIGVMGSKMLLHLNDDKELNNSIT